MKFIGKFPHRNDTILLGTVWQEGRYDREITDADRAYIWDNYLRLHPTFKVLFIFSVKHKGLIELRMYCFP